MDFPDSIKERNDFILEQIKAGNYEHEWYNIYDDCYVSCDALKINGIRINCSYNLQIQIAELLGAVLPSQLMLDFRHTIAHVSILPVLMPITLTTQNMIIHSNRIDREIIRFYGKDVDLKGKIISDVGKTWIMDKNHPNTPINYGFFFSLPSYQGFKGEATTMPGIKCIQSPGFAHQGDHVDYSQICLLAKV